MKTCRTCSQDKALDHFYASGPSKDGLMHICKACSKFSKIKPWNKGTKGLVKPNSGNFTKGQDAWNKGIKGQRYSPATEFKKGMPAVNHKPIGSSRICSKDGYVVLKVAEPSVWRHAHKVEWEKHNGPTPKGMVLRFIDGDKTNYAIENLELITRAENALRNSIHRYPPEVVSMIRQVAKFKREVNKHE
ncbi:MAG: HNH endonuclease [Neisseriaceae bacterium]|nr:HNH endonuclease [Neisseriaceae bacterium]